MSTAPGQSAVWTYCGATTMFLSSKWTAGSWNCGVQLRRRLGSCPHQERRCNQRLPTGYAKTSRRFLLKISGIVPTGSGRAQAGHPEMGRGSGWKRSRNLFMNCRRPSENRQPRTRRMPRRRGHRIIVAPPQCARISAFFAAASAQKSPPRRWDAWRACLSCRYPALRAGTHRKQTM